MDTPIQRAVARVKPNPGRSAPLAGVAVLFAAACLAAEPAPRATLLPPQPVAPDEPTWGPGRPAVRASAAELSPNAPVSRPPGGLTRETSRTERAPEVGSEDKAPSPAATADDKGKGRTYPPTYSSTRPGGLVDLNSAWQRIAPNRSSVNDKPEPKAPAARDARTLPVGGNAPRSTLVPGQPQAIPPQHALVAPPAWRWYGYGNVTPSVNLFGAGEKHPGASSSWLTQSGATAGAFPQGPPGTRSAPIGMPVYLQPAYQPGPSTPAPEPAPAVPVLPALPEVKGPTTEPELVKPLPTERAAEASKPDVSKPPSGGASLGPPLPPTGLPLPENGGPAPDLLLPPVEPGAKSNGWPTLAQPRPVSLNGGMARLGPVARGLAPQPSTLAGATALAPKAVQDRVRRAAGHVAEDLTVLQPAAGALTVRFTVASQNLAEPAVNRIAAVPELAAYQIDFEVSSR